MKKLRPGSPMVRVARASRMAVPTDGKGEKRIKRRCFGVSRQVLVGTLYRVRVGARRINSLEMDSKSSASRTGLVFSTTG